LLRLRRDVVRVNVDAPVVAAGHAAANLHGQVGVGLRVGSASQGRQRRGVGVAVEQKVAVGDVANASPKLVWVASKKRYQAGEKYTAKKSMTEFVSLQLVTGKPDFSFTPELLTS
jgi:hypothetical protein